MAGVDNLKPFSKDDNRASLAGQKSSKKGKKHINTWIQELLEDENFETTIIDAKTGVRDYKGAPLKAIINAQAHLALHSRDETTRIKATDLLLKYGWPSKSETENTGEITHKYEDMDDEQLAAVIKARKDRVSGTA